MQAVSFHGTSIQGNIWTTACRLTKKRSKSTPLTLRSDLKNWIRKNFFFLRYINPLVVKFNISEYKLHCFNLTWCMGMWQIFNLVPKSPQNSIFSTFQPQTYGSSVPSIYIFSQMLCFIYNAMVQSFKMIYDSCVCVKYICVSNQWFQSSAPYLSLIFGICESGLCNTALDS